MALSQRAALLVSMMTELALVGQTDSERVELLSAGWVPFGMNVKGIEGWGKMIDGKSVIVDQPEALAIERGQGATCHGCKSHAERS